MSEDTYKGLTAEQWHNAYQDLKRKYNKASRIEKLQNQLYGCYQLDKQMGKNDGAMDLSIRKILDINTKRMDEIMDEIMDELIDLSDIRPKGKPIKGK